MSADNSTKWKKVEENSLDSSRYILKDPDAIEEEEYK